MLISQVQKKISELVKCHKFAQHFCYFSLKLCLKETLKYCLRPIGRAKVGQRSGHLVDTGGFCSSLNITKLCTRGTLGWWIKYTSQMPNISNISEAINCKRYPRCQKSAIGQSAVHLLISFFIPNRTKYFVVFGREEIWFRRKFSLKTQPHFCLTKTFTFDPNLLKKPNVSTFKMKIISYFFTFGLLCMFQYNGEIHIFFPWG